ncbi:MAG TPA: dienelactone hydrolase family protein [Burkholderiales bacterium]|nr:dienelactone hydrolase family protein [Burkholderiales bacterium]
MRAWASLLGLALAAGCAQARVVEEQTKVQVKVLDGYGKEVAREIVVTIWRDTDSPQPHPALVLNHGRAPKAATRAALGRAKYSQVSDWLAREGFIVAVPTRIGYGVTGGDDVEDSGDCFSKNYRPGYLAAAVQTLAVLEMLRARPDVAPERAVVMGQSYGGTTAIAVAALNPPGVQAAVNFAGGGGGNPETRPGSPCAPDRLRRLFADYGKAARIPTLWIYTENDRYMGPTYPREWFDAFRAEGGPGEYTRYPPSGQDGHGLFTRAPDIWAPRVLEFLRANGYPAMRPLEFRKPRSNPVPKEAP